MNSAKAIKRKHSIKLKLITLPLIIIFIAILGIGAISSFLIRDSLLKQMRLAGIDLAHQVANQMETAYISLETVDEMVEDKIRLVGKTIVESRDNISNERLIQMTKSLDVHEINIINQKGEVIYSSISGNIGYIVDEKHASYPVLKGEKTELMEEIRQSITSSDYYKYGYITSYTGDVIQVGVLANNIYNLSERFSYQRIIEGLVENEDIIYALFTDVNLIAVAHSDRGRIGLDLRDDEASQAAAGNGNIYTSEYFYDVEDIDVYDVAVPVWVSGEHIGAINIGLSMENVYSAIYENILRVSVLGIICFLIIGGILFKISSYVIKIVDLVRAQLSRIASGDLTTDFSKNYLDLKDEFGQMIFSIRHMQKSIKEMIRGIAITSQQVASSSEELTATSHQSARAADEVARTIEEIAKGAGDQAKNTEDGAENMNIFGQLIEKEQQYVKDLNISIIEVDTLKNEGIESLKTLVQKSEENNEVAKEVNEIIIDTNESAEKIESASQMIRTIAEQTSLLALNAAIEAARAGDAGRGFAVVAEEIRKLADQSNTFTEEIGKIIEELTHKTLDAVEKMKRAGEIVAYQTESVESTNLKFQGINYAIEKMKNVVEGINASGQEMNQKKTEVMGIIENLSAISEENAASTEEAAASIEEQTASMEEIASASEVLAKLGEEMQESVSKFKY